jgi:carbon storage regulator
MLILTRRAGEGISIGPDVEITILDVSGDHVRIGISAPREVLVLRSELRREVEAENRLAASGAAKVALGLGKVLKLPHQGP